MLIFFYFKGVFSGSLSPNGVPSSKAAVSNEDTKVHVDFVNKSKLEARVKILTIRK